jgi:CRM1 C terminal
VLASSWLTSIAVCYELVNNFADTDPGIANAFYQQYLLSTLQDILFVLSDSDHKSGRCISRSLPVNYRHYAHHRLQITKYNACTSDSVGGGGSGSTAVIRSCNNIEPGHDKFIVHAGILCQSFTECLLTSSAVGSVCFPCMLRD